MRTIVCQRCGGKTQTTGTHAKYCPACREKVKYGANRKTKTRKVNTSVVQAALAARAAGLSYGEWERLRWLENQTGGVQNDR